jgi:hypothetical protein
MNFRFIRQIVENTEKQSGEFAFVLDGYDSWSGKLVFRIKRSQNGETFYFDILTPEIGFVQFRINPKLPALDVEKTNNSQLVSAKNSQAQVAAYDFDGRFTLLKSLREKGISNFGEYQDAAYEMIKKIVQILGGIETPSLESKHYENKFIEVDLLDTKKVFNFLNMFFSRIGVNFKMVGLKGIDDLIYQLLEIDNPSDFEDKKNEIDLYTPGLDAKVSLLAKLFDSTAGFTKMRRGFAPFYKALIGINQAVRKAIPQSNQKQLSSSSD